MTTSTTKTTTAEDHGSAGTGVGRDGSSATSLSSSSSSSSSMGRATEHGGSTTPTTAAGFTGGAETKRVVGGGEDRGANDEATKFGPVEAKIVRQFEHVALLTKFPTTIGSPTMSPSDLTLSALKTMYIPEDMCQFNLCWDPFDSETVSFEDRLNRDTKLDRDSLVVAHFRYAVFHGDEHFDHFVPLLRANMRVLQFLVLNITSMWATDRTRTSERFVTLLSRLTAAIPHLWITLTHMDAPSSASTTSMSSSSSSSSVSMAMNEDEYRTLLIDFFENHQAVMSSVLLDIYPSVSGKRALRWHDSTEDKRDLLCDDWMKNKNLIARFHTNSLP